MLEIGYGPIEINLADHCLFLGVIVVIVREGGCCNFDCGKRGWALELLFVNYSGVGVVFDGLLIAAQHKLGVSFGEIVLDHVVVTKLQSLPDVFQARFVFLQLVVDSCDQIVQHVILLVPNQAVPEQLLRR